MTKINKFLLVFRLKLPVSALITVARTSLWNPCNVTSKGKLVVQCRPSMMSWKIYTPFFVLVDIYPFYCLSAKALKTVQAVYTGVQLP